MNRYFEFMNLPIILDRFTRIQYISNFPMKKYTTFYYSLPELPMDVIKYIMYIMIDTDKIHLRLSIMEALFLHLNINKLNIKFPECSLNFYEMQEAMLIKLYSIVYKDKISYDHLPRICYQCTLCDCASDIKINDVIMNIRCYHKLRDLKNKIIIEDIPVLNVSEKELKELNNITYVKYLKYNKYDLEFVSKKVQVEKKNLKMHLKKLIEQEQTIQKIYEKTNKQYHNLLTCKPMDNHSYNTYIEIYCLNHILNRPIAIYNYNDKFQMLNEVLKNEKAKTNILKLMYEEYIKWLNHPGHNIFKENVKLQKTTYNQHVNKVKIPKPVRTKVNIYGKR